MNQSVAAVDMESMSVESLVKAFNEVVGIIKVCTYQEELNDVYKAGEIIEHYLGTDESPLLKNDEKCRHKGPNPLQAWRIGGGHNRELKAALDLVAQNFAYAVFEQHDDVESLPMEEWNWVADYLAELPADTRRFLEDEDAENSIRVRFPQIDERQPGLLDRALTL